MQNSIGYGSFHVKSPKKKTILNPTLSEFNQIRHTCWFWPPNPKSKIFRLEFGVLNHLLKKSRA